MNKALLWVIVAVVVIGGAWIAYADRDAADTNMDAAGGTVLEGSNEPDGPAGVDTGIEVDATVSPVKSFTVAASNFKFSVPEMRVAQGDTVRVTLVNSAGNHDWKIDEFNAGTKVLSGGQSETIEFVANKTGSFEYYCSVGSHRQMGMKGTLIVE